MSNDEPRFKLEVNEEISPDEMNELHDLIDHVLDGGSVVYLASYADEEDVERLREFVSEEIRGDTDE